MAEIFISWGKPDEASVKRVVDALHTNNFDVFEYSNDMRAGDKIHARVMHEINTAKIAVIRLSDQTTERAIILRPLRRGSFRSTVPRSWDRSPPYGAPKSFKTTEPLVDPNYCFRNDTSAVCRTILQTRML
jgi:hypothetical protein